MLPAKRFVAIMATFLLLVAACGPAVSEAPASAPPSATTGASESMSASPSASGEDPTAVCAADTHGCVEYPSGQPIRIGTALVITGADASLGLDSQYGVQTAGALKGMVLGRSVTFDHQDDGCGAEGGTTAARLLVADPTILAVIGTSCSSAGIPAAEILSGEGVVLISPSNTAPSLTDPATHQEFYLRTAHNDKIQGAAMAQFACEELEGIENAATIHDGSPYAEQLQAVFAQEFQSRCGGTITAQEAVGPNDTDMRPVLTTIAAGDPDILYFPIFTAAGALVTQQARSTTGLEDVVLAGADGLFSETFFDAAGDAADEMYLSGPDLAFSGTAYEGEFLPKYIELSGEDAVLSVFHAHAFDATNMIFAAIEAVGIEGSDGTLYIPRTAFKDALFATSGYTGITGTLTCDANGDCADAKISVSQVQNNTWPPVRIWPES